MSHPLTDGSMGFFDPEFRFREHLNRISDLASEIERAERRGHWCYAMKLRREKRRRDGQIWGRTEGGSRD